MNINLSSTDWKQRREDAEQLARDIGQQLFKFSVRYGAAVGALIVSAFAGWSIANGVSDYTKGGWETHIVQRNIGIDIHFHHWYYGIPLGLIALLLISRQTTLSIFLFGLGAALSTHSYVNEGGIPALFENGATWKVPTEIYLPAVTLFCVLYAFFLLRREEWLSRAREREEIAMSYLCPSAMVPLIMGRIDKWASARFRRRRVHQDRWTAIRYAYWRTPDPALRGEWQLHTVCSPFDAHAYLLVIKLHHLPMAGRKGTLDEWMVELDRLVQPEARLALADGRMADLAPADPARQAGN
ncbi:MAG: hypothetical protein HZB53_07895 [Chloroflexi bacterium]|nr:hypothetical protein [Chloroflexota bacterium]